MALGGPLLFSVERHVRSTEEPQMPQSIELLITVREACKRLGVGRTTLYQLCRAGAIRSVRVGSRGIRIPVRELDRFVEERLAC